MSEGQEITRYTAPDGKELTDRQSAYVYHLVVKNCTPADAAEAAGYSSPRGALSGLRSNPAVSAVIHREIQLAFSTSSAAALGVIQELMADPTTPKGVRLDCAKTILNRAGHVEQKAREPEKTAKDVNDLSADELEDLIQNLQDKVKDKTAIPGDTAPAGALPSPLPPIESNT